MCGRRLTGVLPVQPYPAYYPTSDPVVNPDAERSTPESESRTAALVILMAVGLIALALGLPALLSIAMKAPWP